MVSVMLYPCIFGVALLMYLFVLCVACLTVFMNCLVKQFAICLGVVAILLLNVMEVFSWIDHVWSSIECVCCACGPSERLDSPSIWFVCVFVCRKLSPHFGVLRTGSQEFALLTLFLCVIFHTMSSGKSLQLLCIFLFGMLCLSAISMMFVKILLAVCVLWSERNRTLCLP